MRQLILGTAGHIDHGKTALVRALTGTDTDRLPEEKRRGITIDLGFASLDLPDGTRLGIVDVPGHEAFIRNMLAGTTGIDMVLLVVAADEGVMPQTREHLAIVDLLGIPRGVVALTKADLVDAEWLELVRDDVRGLIAASSLAAAPIVEVSARTGAGMDGLRAALDDVAGGVAERRGGDLFRMPVDRVFTVRGTGTVVTGTVWSGTLRRDEQVRVEPAGFTARVRGLQRHGAECDAVHAGERAAVALAGTERQALGRGDALVAGGAWQATSMLTIDLVVLGDCGSALRPRQRVRVHLGTAEVLARLALPEGPVEPGGRALCQLRLEQPVIARAGDRLVIRSYSPVHTVGGGTVLEPVPPKRKRFPQDVAAALRQLADPRSALAAAVRLAGATGVRLEALPVVTGLAPADAAAAVRGAGEATGVGDRLVEARHLSECRDAVLRCLERFHEAAPMADGMEREALRREAAPDTPSALFDAVVQELTGSGQVAGRDRLLALGSFRAAPPPEARARMERLLAIHAAAGLQAPDVADLPPELAALPELPLLLRFLEREGALVRLTPTRWTDAAALDGAVTLLRERLPAGHAAGIAELRDLLGLTRKHLIPLLEHFDRTGVTVRAGDARTLAPAAGRTVGNQA